MKKISFTLILMALATLAWSQGPRNAGQRPERPSSAEMIKKATQELTLTSEQVTQWTEIHEKYEANLKIRSKERETMQAMGKELEATLTEEQLEKFQQMQKRQRPPREGNE